MRTSTTRLPFRATGCTTLCWAATGVLWLATYGGGLNKLDPHTNAFRHLTHRINSDAGLAHPFVRAILQTPDGDVWFGTKDGISIWTEATGGWRHLLAGGAESRIVTSLALQRGRVYAGTFQGGVVRHRPGDVGRPSGSVPE